MSIHQTLEKLIEAADKNLPKNSNCQDIENFIIRFIDNGNTVDKQYFQSLDVSDIDEIKATLLVYSKDPNPIHIKNKERQKMWSNALFLLDKKLVNAHEVKESDFYEVLIELENLYPDFKSMIDCLNDFNFNNIRKYYHSRNRNLLNDIIYDENNDLKNIYSKDQRDYLKIKKMTTSTKESEIFYHLSKLEINKLLFEDYYNLIYKAIDFKSIRLFDWIIKRKADNTDKSINLVNYIIETCEIDSIFKYMINELLKVTDINQYYNNNRLNIVNTIADKKSLTAFNIFLEHNIQFKKINDINNIVLRHISQEQEYLDKHSSFYKEFFNKILPLLTLNKDEKYNYGLNFSYLTKDWIEIARKNGIDIFNLRNEENLSPIELILLQNTEDKIEIINNHYDSLKDSRDIRGNNVLHYELSNRGYFQIAEKLITKPDMLDCFFETNMFNIKPIDLCLNNSGKIEIAIMFWTLNNMIKKESKHYIYLSELEEVYKDYIEEFKINRDSLVDSNLEEGVMMQLKNIINKLDIFYPNSVNYTFYELYSDKKVLDLEKHINEFDNGKESKLYPWVQKMKNKSGKRKLVNNDLIKENLHLLRSTFPNFKEFIDHVESYIYLNEMGDGHFNIPPSLLVSAPGIGKTFFLNTLAKYVGVTYEMISMESVSAGFALVGGNSQWSSSNPGLIFTNILNSEYVNNILILDEIDKTPKSNYPVDTVLLPLLESHTAQKFKDEFMQIPLDIRKTVWVATANDIDEISEPIKSRFQIFNIKSPNFKERMILTNAIYKTLLDSNKWGSKFEKNLTEDVQSIIANDDNSSRDLRKSLLKACGKAAKRGDNKIIVDDLDIGFNNKTIELWDKKHEKDE